MTSEKFHDVFEAQLAECRAEMGVKNADYASPENGDFLANFYETARRCDTTELQSWLVHFTKHIIAIEKYVKRGGHLTSEPIRGRIKDGINYLFLLRALVEELECATVEPSSSSPVGPPSTGGA
jgi:hypothetical protein